MKRMLLFCIALAIAFIAATGSAWSFDRCALCESGAPQIDPDKPPPNPDPPPRNPCNCQRGGSDSKCPEGTTQDQGCGGDPIELKGRTLSITRTDFVLNGILPIRFDFSYRTSGNMVGHFGLGWYFNYDIRINRDESGNYYFRGEAGEMRKYGPDGRQLEGAISKDGFKVNANGTYSMERYDGLIYEFNSWGILSYIFDRNGNHLHFIYEDNGTGSPVRLPTYGVSRYLPYTDFFQIAGYDYRLKRIENGLSPTKQSVDFTYNAFGLVQDATDHTGRVWQYVYDPSYGTLVKVINPTGEFVYYAFNPARPLLPTSFVNESHAAQDGKSLIVTSYDAEGKASGQTYNGMNYTPTDTAFVYGSVDTNFAAGKSKKSVYILKYGAVSKNYDGNGVLISTHTLTYFDTNTSYFPAYRPAETHIRKRGVHTVIGPTGTSTTMTIDTMEYLSEKGVLTKRILPDGSFLTFQYDEKFRPTLQARNVKNPVTGDTSRYYTRKEYLGRFGLPTRVVEGEFGGDSSVIIYVYDPNSMKLRYEKRLVDPSDEGSAIITEYRYDALGLLVETADPLGRLTRYEYDEVAFGSTNNVGLGFLTSITNPAKEKTTWQNDQLGNPIMEKDPMGGQKTTVFDALSRPVKACDQTAICTEFTYKDSRLLKREDGKVGSSAGRVTRFEYDNFGRVRREIREMGASGDYVISDRVYDANDRVVKDSYQGGLRYTYKYDPMGHAIEARDSAGKVWSTYFDVNGNPYLEKDPLGFQTEWVYDALGRLLKHTDAAQMALPVASRKSQTWKYDFHGRPVQHVDALGRTTKTFYDGLGQVTKIIGYRTDTTRFTYKSGRLESSRDAEGGMVFYTYDGADRIVRKLSKEGDTRSLADTSDYVEDFKFDANGRLVRSSIAGKAVQRLEYTPRGEVASDTDGVGTIRKYTYSPTGEIISVALPASETINLEYDKLGRLTKRYDAFGILETVIYSANSRVVDSRIPGKGSLITTYAATGEVLKTQDSTGVTLTHMLDDRHMVASSHDALGNYVQYTRDGVGQVLSRRDERGFFTYTVYDPVGRVASLKDNEGNTIAYTQTDNPGGFTTTQTYSDGAWESNTSDRMGRTVQIQDRKGLKTKMRYDMLGRMKEKELDDQSKAKFTYYQNGLVRTGEYSGNKSEFQYDGLFRATQHKQTVLGETFTVKYKFRDDSNAIHMTYPDGFLVDVLGDSRGRLSRVSTSTSAAFDYAYSNNLMTSLSRSNSVNTAFGYDAGGRVNLIRHARGATTLEEYRYGFNTRGQETYQKLVHDLPSSLALTYTPDGRLNNFKKGTLNASNQVPSPLFQQAWTLDSRGNWNTNIINGVTESRTHDGMNRLLAAGATGFSYDSSGNTLSLDGMSMNWDNQNKLKSAGSNIYSYDAFGRRVAKQLSDGTTEKFIYDGQRALYKKTSSGLSTRYVYGGPYIDDFLYASKSDGSAYFPLIDAQYSVVGITDNSGNLVEQVRYEAYGAFRILNASGTEIAGSSVGNEILYTGQRYDKESGLYYYRERYYDPGLGRFISSDPIGVLGGVNSYGYVGGDPYDMTDPYGLICWETFGPKDWRTMGLGAMDAAATALLWTAGGIAIVALAPAAAPFLLVAGLGIGAYTTARDVTDLVRNQDQMTNEEFAFKVGQTGVNTAALLAGGAGARKGFNGGAGEELGGVGRGSNPNGSPSPWPKAGFNAKDVNPGKFDMNCVSCALAMDKTLGGDPHIAGGPHDPLPISVLGTNWKPVASQQHLESILINSGIGSRGIVYGDPKGPQGTGHVWNAVNQKGNVNHIDAQSGGSGTKNYQDFQNFLFLQTR